ncbi:unnamed protein product, partial [Notodromas monacha]
MFLTGKGLSSPHLSAGNHLPGQRENCIDGDPSNALPVFIFMVAQLLLGCGGSPLFTLGTTYIDDHVKKESSAMYIGFMFSFGAFGPVCGFLLGAYLLSFHADSYMSDMNDFQNVDVSDPGWIGLWWGGFLVCGILLMLGALPFFAFPKELWVNLTAACNFGCECSTNDVEPVCGRNGVTYFSPCHAGCTSLSSRYNYSDCACIQAGVSGNVTGIAPTAADVTAIPVATAGPCAPVCDSVMAFLVLLFFMTFVVAITQMPLLMIVLRSVDEEERSFALGMQFLRSNETKPVHLHICTDGQISTEDVHYSDSLLANVEFHTVDVCIEQTSHLGVDVSVAIPFLRNSKYTVTANGTLAMQGNSKIPLYPIIKTLEDFLHVKDELWHRYYPKFVGLQHLTPELQHFKSWLIATKKECIKAAAPRGIHKLLRLLQDGKEDEAVDILRLGKPCDDPSPEESIEAHFAPLVNLTSQIKFPLATYLKYPVSRVARRPNADFIQKVDLWGDFNTGESLETLCNITGEMDIPVLMIRKCDAGLFDSLEPACIDYMVTMPLNTLLSSKACNKLASILDFPIGYKAYFQWVHTGGHNTSPYTRESIIGCIPISSHPKLIAYSNNMISHLFWGGKKVGTPVLWMWVLYFVIQEHKACEYLRSSHQDFIKVFQKVIVKRSCEEMTRLGMSGLGNFPATPVPVSVACWYAVRGSSLIFAEKKVQRTQERLLQFSSKDVEQRVKNLNLLKVIFNAAKFNLEYATKLVLAASHETHQLTMNDSFYSVSTDENRFIVYDTLLSPEKSPDPHLPKVFADAQLSLQLFQGYVKPAITGPVPFAKFTRIPLPINLPALQPVTEIQGGQYSYIKTPRGEYIFADSAICPATMRCYSQDPVSGKPWEQAAQQTMGPLATQVSGYNYYLRTCCKAFKHLSQTEKESGIDSFGKPIKFPDVNQFLLVAEKGQVKKGFHTLPQGCHKQFEKIAEKFFGAREKYKEVTGTEVTPKVFLQIIQSGWNKSTR